MFTPLGFESKARPRQNRGGRLGLEQFILDSLDSLGEAKAGPVLKGGLKGGYAVAYVPKCRTRSGEPPQLCLLLLLPSTLAVRSRLDQAIA